MSTIEQLFLATKPHLEKSIQEALDAAMDKIYTEYLPHVENDTYFNVRQQTKDWILKYINDSLTDEDIKIDFTYQHCWKSADIRKKIYEDNKVEIQTAIGKDLEEQVSRLKSELAAAYRRY